MNRTLWAVVVSVALPGVVGAQNVSTGGFVRSFSFAPGIGARRVTQWGIPVSASATAGRRVTFSFSGAWVSNELASHDGWSRRFAGVTDAEARVAYVVGHDFAVITIAGNLPIGTTPTTADRAVTGATASSMFAFPITEFRMGPAATGAVAIARRLGGVNVGVGAGVRWAGAFQPVRDEPTRFSPALEERVHAGADALLLGGRLGVNGGVSTFTSDALIRTGVDAAPERRYQPGLRSMLEVNYVAPLGSRSRSLGLDGWVFTNGAARDSVLGDPLPREVIASFSGLVTVPLASALIVSSGVELRRRWRDGRGGDRLLSAQVGWVVGLGSNTHLLGSARYDVGRITAESGDLVSVKGFGFTIGFRRDR